MSFINITGRLLFICWVAVQSGVPAFGQKKVALKASSETSPGSKEANVADHYKMGVLAKAFGDSVVVRWAPDKPELFRAGLQGGYLLTRRSFNDDNSQTLDFQVLVKPWPVDMWLKNVSKNDTLAAACAQLVNGKNTPLKSDETLTLDKIMQQQSQTDLRMTMAIILADIKTVYATGMGLGFIDKTVKKGKRYAYFLKPMVDATRFDVEVVSTYLVNEKSVEAEQMLPVKVTSGEHHIQLSWERQAAETKFASYYFERSDNGGKSFQRLNRIPWLQPMENALHQTITYGDSVKENYHPYQYRVLGLTPFGELISSEIVTGTSLDKTAPPAVTNMKAKYLGKSKVRISWKYENAPVDLAGFIIGKSSSLDGEFTPVYNKILPTDKREFIDSTLLPGSSYYYKIVALDTARNLGVGLPVYCIVNERKGPSKPKNLQGYIDSTGLVRIVWDTNPEPNIYGYKVLSANAADHVFIAETPGYLAVSGFNDSTSLNTLTKKKYFKVVAYDKNYNPGEPSDILSLTRPDIVRPVSPVINKYSVADSAITFSWALSASSDVKDQILMRRGKSTERWQTIATLKPDVSTYSDETIKGESDYGYALVAVDSSGLKSDVSFPLNVKTPRITPPVIKGLRGFINPDKSVSLYWDYSVPYCKYTIYRADEKNSLLSYDSVYDNHEFRDKRPEKGLIKYAVRVIFQDGRQSKLSSTIEVNVK